MADISYCVAVLKSGLRKGEFCGCKAKYGTEDEPLCGKHNSNISSNKNSNKNNVKSTKSIMRKNTVPSGVGDKVLHTITITYGDQAENHVGMEKLGKLAAVGLSNEDLTEAQNKFQMLGDDVKTEIINLNSYLPDDVISDEATVLIVRNGVDLILKEINKNADIMFKEQSSLEWDTKAKMYGRVCNKHARYNLCYNIEEQEPDYENGKGRVVSFTQIPCTSKIRDKLALFFGSKCESDNIVAEGNLYYNVNTCGIGFHGDAERKIVIAVRLGETVPLHYQWWYNSNEIGPRIKLDLHHGDLYAMSEKATGNDWRKKKIPTLRHAAGCEKYL